MTYQPFYDSPRRENDLSYLDASAPSMSWGVGALMAVALIAIMVWAFGGGDRTQFASNQDIAVTKMMPPPTNPGPAQPEQ